MSRLVPPGRVTRGVPAQVNVLSCSVVVAPIELHNISSETGLKLLLSECSQAPRVSFTSGRAALLQNQTQARLSLLVKDLLMYACISDRSTQQEPGTCT